MRLVTLIAGLIVCTAFGLPASLAASAAEPRDLEGLWEGRAVFARAELEADLVVELARKPEGPWVGTIDVPNQRLQFHPLDAVRVSEEGPGLVVELVYSRFVPELGRRVTYGFRGTLSPDGGRVEGEVEREDGPPVPFVLEQLGPPGMPRPERPEMEVHDLAPDAGELRARFEADRGRTRLLMLLSPT